jgi:hypothetical protein
MNICKALIFSVFLLAVSCDKPLPTLEGVDAQRWKEDKNGCLDFRRNMWCAIEKEKEKLLALNELQITTLLGKPDQHELYKRNQKFYYYFIDDAPSCAPGKDSTAQKLVIRFNAMGLAKEVSIE